MVNKRFQNIINSPKPVLVDFYTDWCHACKEIPLVINKVKSDLKQGFRIVKVNVDKNPFIASKYKINSLPTLIIFKDGIPQWIGEGVCKPEELKTAIHNQLRN